MTDTKLQYQEGVKKISELAEDLAKQNGLLLTSIQFDRNRPAGSLDFHIVELESGGCSVSEKLHHEEIEDYPGRAGTELTRAKIGSAIERLKVMIQG